MLNRGRPKTRLGAPWHGAVDSSLTSGLLFGFSLAAQVNSTTSAGTTTMKTPLRSSPGLWATDPRQRRFGLPLARGGCRPVRRRRKSWRRQLRWQHVSGPVVLAQRVQRVGMHLHVGTAVLRAEFLQELLDQLRDIFLALAQRRDEEGNDVEAVEQVMVDDDDVALRRALVHERHHH